VLVEVLDGILDGHHVVVLLGVDQIDHRRQRRGLARARRSRDEHQPLVQGAQVEDRVREPQLLRREDLLGDHPEHRPGSAVVLEEVGAEPCEAWQGVAEVGVGHLLELGPVALRRDLAEHLLHLDRIEDRRLLDGDHLPVEAQHRAPPARHVEVGRTDLLHPLEEGVDPGHGAPRQVRAMARSTRPAPLLKGLLGRTPR